MGVEPRAEKGEMPPKKPLGKQCHQDKLGNDASSLATLHPPVMPQERLPRRTQPQPLAASCLLTSCQGAKVQSWGVLATAWMQTPVHLFPRTSQVQPARLTPGKLLSQCLQDPLAGSGLLSALMRALLLPALPLL